MTLNGGLAEQIDRIRVGSGRVGAHARVRFQALASAHQKHLLCRHHAAFPLDRLLQLGHAARKKFIKHARSIKIGKLDVYIEWRIFFVERESARFSLVNRNVKR